MREKTWPVGSKKPNDLGLFDMQGNVFTWCQDSYKPLAEGEAALEDQEGDLVILRTRNYIVRGGSFLNPASYARSANRNNSEPSARNRNYGFRPARTMTPDRR